jgi:hypothetical protein
MVENVMIKCKGKKTTTMEFLLLLCLLKGCMLLEVVNFVDKQRRKRSEANYILKIWRRDGEVAGKK